MLRENAWKKYDSEKLQEMNSFCDKYKNFISECKTERECVTFAVEEIKKAGYVDLNEVISSGRELKSQDKVYVNYMGKALAMFQIGDVPMEKGMNLLGAHVDSPRLDLKQDPLYEDSDLALLDTHY